MVKDNSILDASPARDNIPAFLRSLVDQAIDSAAPVSCLPQHLPKPPIGRTFVVAVGKAAASMAKVVEDHWPKEASFSGIALTRYGHGCECQQIKVIEASHPVPDEQGYKAAQTIMQEVAQLGANDLLLFLVSGGGSSLLSLPAKGIDLAEKKQINQALLMSGAPIGEINIVRKHLSAIKGGRLAEIAQPASIVTLAISDVPGDDPSTIASGPTVGDPSTRQQAVKILERHQIIYSENVSVHLQSERSESPDSNNSIFDETVFKIITRPGDMIDELEKSIRELGVKVISLGAELEGEAGQTGREHAKLAIKCLEENPATPTLIISGGETTVTVDIGAKAGKGGRNCEYLLALAVWLDGTPGIHAIAADTDGIDGSQDNAGAQISPTTLQRGKALGLDAKEYLGRHDSYCYFAAINDLVMTGPTLTNVNDIRIILIEAEG